MKTIIAGGRNLQPREFPTAAIDAIHDQQKITEVVSGGASGADRMGEWWASDKRIPVKVFKPNWSHGRAGGPIRNKQMADYADAVILLPGGRGTDSMFEEACKAQIRIFDLRIPEKTAGA